LRNYVEKFFKADFQHYIKKVKILQNYNLLKIKKKEMTCFKFFIIFVKIFQHFVI